MKLRSLLLKLAGGVEKERFEHCLLIVKSFETELPKLQRENRELKTKVKDLKLKERKDRMSSDSPKLTLKSISTRR